MAKADWDIYEITPGLYHRSTLQSVSATHSMTSDDFPGTTGKSRSVRFFYNGNSSLENVRMIFQYKGGQAYNQKLVELFFRANQLNPISNCYRLIMGVGLVGYGAYSNVLQFSLNRYLAGMPEWIGWEGTRCFQWTVGIPGGLAGWVKLRTDLVTEYGDPVFRFDLWTGAAWTNLYEYRDNNPTKILAPGYAGFGFYRCSADESQYFDDIEILELTTP